MTFDTAFRCAMRTLPLLLLSLATTSPTAAQAQNVTDEVDRFTGKRVIAYTNSSKTQLEQPTVSIKAISAAGKTMELFSFLIAARPVSRYSPAPSWLAGCRTVDWLVDGSPVQMGMVVSSPIFTGYGRIDNLIQEIPTEMLATLGNATVVEYRLCGHEFRLAAEDVQAARIIAGKLSGAPAPSPRPEAPPASDCVACGKLGGG